PESGFFYRPPHRELMAQKQVVYDNSDRAHTVGVVDADGLRVYRSAFRGELTDTGCADGHDNLASKAHPEPWVVRAEEGGTVRAAGKVRGDGKGESVVGELVGK